jgi:hypothetical protein
MVGEKERDERRTICTWETFIVNEMRFFGSVAKHVKSYLKLDTSFPYRTGPVNIHRSTSQ